MVSLCTTPKSAKTIPALAAILLGSCSTPTTDAPTEPIPQAEPYNSSEQLDNPAQTAQPIIDPDNSDAQIPTQNALRTDDLAAPLVIPTDSNQAIVVITQSWKQSRGELRKFERLPGSSWTPADENSHPVSLGRRGLAWGRGLHPEPVDGPIKSEGDYRSPAGVFDFGEARGFAKAPPPGTTWPFQHSGKQYRCTDDPRSPNYNSFISTVGLEMPPYTGLARREVLMEYMVFVKHNTAPIVRGAGSCVFFHVWAKPSIPTQACIAMSRDALAETLAWMKPESRPVLVQLPESVYKQHQHDWSLPSLEHPVVQRVETQQKIN